MHRKSRATDDQTAAFCEKFTNPVPVGNAQFQFFNPVDLQNNTNVYPPNIDCYLIIKGECKYLNNDTVNEYNNFS